MRINIGFLKEISPIMVEYHDSIYPRPIKTIKPEETLKKVQKWLLKTDFYEEIKDSDEIQDLYQEINTYIWDGKRKNLSEEYLIKNIILYLMNIDDQFKNPKYNIQNQYEELNQNNDKQEYIERCIDLDFISKYVQLKDILDENKETPRILEIFELKEEANPLRLLTDPCIIFGKQ